LQPRQGGQCLEASRLRKQPVPGLAAGVDGRLGVVDAPVSEETFTQVEGDALDAEFGAVGRQVQRGNIGRRDEAFGPAPAGPVEQQDGLGLWIESERISLSSNCITSVITSATPISRAGRTAPKIQAAWCACSRWLPMLEPDMAGAADLADPRLVLTCGRVSPGHRLLTVAQLGNFSNYRKR